VLFVNRKQELEGLQNWLDGSAPGLARLYGRRRLGKTELLQTFCRSVGGAYFLIDEADERRVLSSLSDQAAQQAQTLRPTYRNWNDFYESLPHLGFPVVVLDEFQRLMVDHKIAVTRLQHHWDTNLRRSGPSLILCGSSIGMMQRLTETAKGPLFGRLGFDMRLRPFSYTHMHLLYPKASEEELVRRYAVFGGTPFYHEFSKGRTLKTAIERSFLQDTSPFIDEPQNLLRSELRAPLRYNSIMYQIGHGTHDTKNLEHKAGVKTGGLSPYLKTLKGDMDLLHLEDPVCGTKKRAHYVFSDPFFTFYYRFIFNARPRIEIGQSHRVWEEIDTQLDGHVGRVYEEIIRQVLVLINGKTLHGINIDFDEIGKWWNRPGDEIDVVAVGKNEILAGEVKWTKNKVGPDLLDRLLEKIPLMERTGSKPVRPLLAVRSGLTPAGEARAREEHALVLTLDDVRAITHKTDL